MANKRELIPILFVNFVSTLSFGIVMPFLIILVINYGGNAVIYGILGASFSFFQLIGSPILGRWSDKIGRKPILIVSHVGTILSWIGLYLSLNVSRKEISKINSDIFGIFMITVPLIILFGSRILDGITGGNVSVAYAYLADISEDSEMSQNYGYMAIASNLGYIIGPMISALLSDTKLGLELPVLISLVIGLMGLFTIFLLPDKGIKSGSSNEKNNDASLKRILSIPHLSVLLVINFLVFLAFNIFYVSFPAFAFGDLGWDITDLGYYYSLISVFMVLAQGPLLKAMNKRFPSGLLMIIGGFTLGLGFYFITFESTFAIGLSVIAISVGNGLLYPSLLALIAQHAKGDLQGSIQGLNTSIGSVASILGLLIGGFLVEQFAAFVFVIAALSCLIIAIMSIRFAVMEVDHLPESYQHHINHKFLGSHHLHHVIHLDDDKSTHSSPMDQE